MEGAPFVSDMNQQEKVPPKNIGNECLQCGKVFTRKIDLKNHVKHVHDKIREHICEVCAKIFEYQHTLF